MTKEQFMKLTIASHNLPLWSEQDAANAAPSESAMWFAVMRGKIEKPADKSTFLYSSGRARFLRKKTDYFELRYEDQNQNKKFFHTFAGDGLRYEIKDFVTAILSKEYFYSKVNIKENIRMAEVQEQYLEGVNLYKL